MRRSHPRSFRAQANALRRQFLQDGELPFTDVLTDQLLSQALATIDGWLDRIFSPLVTLWVFLAQVLSPDHSCRAAVARLNAHRVARGQAPCSARTGAYCRARQRLPEEFFSAAARAVGRGLDDRADRRWLWKGRRVYLFDGTTVTMPDTPANQAAYPQVYNQGPGVGFPIARLGAVISLACGAVVNLGFSRYAGKGEGEVSLLRQLWDVLRPGGVLVGDRLMSGWAGMHLLKARGVDTVSRLSAHRRADFRKGTRLGKDDHLVVWRKPTSIRSVDRPTYNALPDAITVREARVRVAQPGFRTRSVVVVTTLLDPEQTTKEELADVYRARWHNELDLRSLKSTMQMAELRSKTPEAVRKEVWAHVLAYNLIRTVMAQAAARHEIPPRSVSFKGAMQTLGAFEPLLALGSARDEVARRDLYHLVLDAIATHRVGDRPDRFEPRLKKRRKDYCGWFTKPRAELKRRMAKGSTEK
ncbi:MAG TPA: IS4 family transposase [Urbifossiella sp.]|nr:IS4 family transposase [Urbifossiella sp.]